MNPKTLDRIGIGAISVLLTVPVAALKLAATGMQLVKLVTPEDRELQWTCILMDSVDVCATNTLKAAATYACGLTTVEQLKVSLHNSMDDLDYTMDRARQAI